MADKRMDALYDEQFELEWEIKWKLKALIDCYWESPTLKKEIESMMKSWGDINDELVKLEEVYCPHKDTNKL